MTPTPGVQERIRRYLLGQLTDGAGEEIEQNLLTNEELFEELLVVEDELIDEYLGGKLSHDDRASFETQFLASPERQEDLSFARALHRYVTVASQQQSTFSKFLAVFQNNQTFLFRAAAAVVVIAAIAGAFWVIRHGTPRPKAFATLTLTISAGDRSEGRKASTVALNADALRIFLRLPNPPPTVVGYRVQLLDDNVETRSVGITGQDAQSLVVEIPSSQLRRGQYALNLFAIKADGTEQRIQGSYSFTVE